jgi:hypothetical protein
MVYKRDDRDRPGDGFDTPPGEETQPGGGEEEKKEEETQKRKKETRNGVPGEVGPDGVWRPDDPGGGGGGGGGAQTEGSGAKDGGGGAQASGGGASAGREIDAEKMGLQQPASTFAQVGGKEQGRRGMMGAIMSRVGLFGKPGQYQFQAGGGATAPGMQGRRAGRAGWNVARPPSGGLGQPGGIESLFGEEQQQPGGLIRQMLDKRF